MPEKPNPNEGTFPPDGVPSGVSEYARSAPEVPNAVSAIEDFFQEPFNDALIDKVAALPYDQYQELRVEYSYTVIDTDSILSYWRNPNYERASYVPGNEYDALKTGELHLHDATLEARRSTTSIAGLKHMAVLCERTAIRNPLPLAIGSERWRFSRQDPADEIAFCAQRLRQLLPLAGLIRSGEFILVRYPGDDRPYDTLINPRFDRYDESRALSYDDPYIKWLLERNPDVLWELRNIYQQDLLKRAAQWDENRRSNIQYDLLGAEQQLAVEVGLELLQKVYRPHVSTSDLKRIMAYSNKITEANLTPVTSDPLILHHMRQCARVALEGEPTIVDDVKDVATISPAVDYGFPSLSEVSFTDIASVRKEGVFIRLRQILLELSAACAHDSQIGSLEAYETAIRGHADDILRPGLAEIEAWGKRASRGVLGGKVLGKVVGFAIDAFAGGVPGIGGAVGKGTEKAVGGRVADTQHAATLAHGILKSLMP